MGKLQTESEQSGWLVLQLFGETEPILLHEWEPLSGKQRAPAAEGCLVPVAPRAPQTPAKSTGSTWDLWVHWIFSGGASFPQPPVVTDQISCET